MWLSEWASIGIDVLGFIFDWDSQSALTFWTMAYTICTFSLLIAAVAAGIYAKEQVSTLEAQIRIQSHQHSEEMAQLEHNRILGIRPHLTIVRGEYRHTGDGRLWIRNVGLGPALEVSVQAWMTPLHISQWDDARAVKAKERELTEQAKSEVPLTFHLAGLTSATTSLRRFRLPGDPPSEGVGGMLTLYRFQYRDMLDNSYPFDDQPEAIQFGAMDIVKEFSPHPD